MSERDALDFDAAYKVDGFRGIAFRLRGYATVEEQEDDFLICEDEECDHQASDMCWIPGEVHEDPDFSMVRAVMVGDDQEHIIDVDDLTVIDEDDYCRECGQVGCSWGAA